MQLPKFTKEQVQEFKDFALTLSNTIQEGPVDSEAHNIALFEEAWGDDYELRMSAFLLWYYAKEGFQ